MLIKLDNIDMFHSGLGLDQGGSVDGDRGGDLIIKEMFQVAEVDYIAVAPTDKEVEELTKKEIFKALRERIPAKQYRIELKTKELKDFIQKSQESSA